MSLTHCMMVSQHKRESKALLVLGILVTGYALLALALASAASLAPSLEVIDVTVTSLAVSPGEPVMVEANVHNPSDQEAEFSVVLLVDEVPEEERLVRLPAGAIQTLRFTVVRSEPGAHAVRVGPHAATFQVLSAQFLVRDLSIDPPVVTPGEPISMRATVENIGAAPGMFQVPLTIDGELVDVRSGLLPVGLSRVVSFETAAEISGSYTVLLGDVPGAFTVVSPTFDIRIPSSIGISLPTTIGTDVDGASLAITGDVVTLSTASDAAEVILPVGLSPGEKLASFRDSVSGIAYDGTTLRIPLRDAVYREVARLELTPGLVTGQETTVRFVAEGLLLVVPDTPLQFPPSTALVEPVSFSIEVALAGLTLDAPLRLTPGLRPAQESLARVELEARVRSRTVAQVVALATVEAPTSVSEEQGIVAMVAFGVPSSWLESVDAESLEVALIGESGAVELSPVSETVSEGTQTFLRSEVSQGQGTFVLVVLSEGDPPKISQVVLPEPVAVAGVPVEIRAFVEAAPANAVLRVKGEPVAVEPVRLLEDGSRAAVFYLAVDAPGVYPLAVEGVGAELTAGLRDVTGYAQVFQLSISPQEAAPGETVDVRATVGNVGPRAVVSEAILLVNGAPIERRLLAISSGGTAEVHLDLTRSREGVYKVELLNARGEFTLATEPTPASFQVTDLRTDPSTADPGQPVHVTFTLKNSGELEGTYLARAFLDKREEERREIPVGGLTSLPVTFTLQPQGEGIFTVEVGDERRDFVVVSPRQRSDLVLETLSIEPPTVAGGEQVVVTVNVRNRATIAASGVLTVLVNEEIVAERELAVEARERTQETFSISGDTPGLYQVEVRQGVALDVVTDVLKGEFLVTRKQSPASWEISRLEVTPQPARPDEPIAIGFLLSNLGQQAGELTVTVEVDGVQEAEETMVVGPQTTRQVTFALTGRPEGAYVVAVNGTEVRFTVVSVAEETPVAVVTPTEVASEQGRPPWGFVVVVAVLLVVLAGAVYGLLGRRRTG